MALVINTIAQTEPVSLDEAKDHLRITADTEDEILYMYIRSATAWAQEYAGYKLCTQTWTHYLDKFPADIYKVPFPPLQSITHIKYYDSSDAQQTLVADTDYRVDVNSVPGRVEPIVNWPGVKDKVNPVEVKFICGYSDRNMIPDTIKTAVLLRVADLYENRQETYVTQGALSIQRGTLTAMSLLDQVKLFNITW